MPRPSISKTTRLRVIQEAGNRCAVCGQSSPVVLSHIVSFVDGGESTEKNLIALCPNCHARADAGDISAAELRASKEHPWAFRTKSATPEKEKTVTVRLTIDGDVEFLDQAAQERLIKAIALFLGTGVTNVKIHGVKQG